MKGRTLALVGVALAAVAAVAVLGAWRWASAGELHGDANCDGTVNSVDAALVLQYDAGLIDSVACQDAADANGDGTVNSLDAALILQFDAGLIDSLGPLPTATPPTPTPTATPPLPSTPTPPTAPTPSPTPTPGDRPRPLPDTTDGIHVFNDQLINLNPRLTAFAATHYDGTQKMTRADADALRAVNPDFVILNYRLALGLGYRQPDANCLPNGAWLGIVDGDWTQEWPGDEVVQDAWFYEVDGQRVLHCRWGWYLMDPDDPGWRNWWSDTVLSQLANNDNDGLFADSFSVPNYLGADEYDPALPAFDPAFEADWTARIEDFIAYVQSRFAGRYYLIPNVGDWVTGRDAVDYSGADGVMIEGFGFDAWETYGQADWELELDRALGLINQGKVIIAQSYSLDDANTRLFTLGSYLLIKGDRTYVNLDAGEDPEWWPEYDILIGTPEGETPANVAELFDTDWGVYARNYSNGLVLVNADSSPRAIDLGRTYYLARPSGGGTVPSSGVLPPTWTVSYSDVSQVTLDPGAAAVLLLAPPPAAE